MRTDVNTKMVTGTSVVMDKVMGTGLDAGIGMSKDMDVDKGMGSTWR